MWLVSYKLSGIPYSNFKNSVKIKCVYWAEISVRSKNYMYHYFYEMIMDDLLCSLK